jgi:hypothetical protein
MKRLLLFQFFILAAALAVAQASHLDTTFTEYFRRSQGWTAGDATISIPMPNGDVMWLFGDSYIDNYDASDNTLPCLFQVRNCMVIQDQNDLNQMTTYIDSTKSGIDRTYFKIDQVGKTVYWPGHGFVKKDTVFVFLEKYNGTTLKFLGNFIAKIQLPGYKLISITALPQMNELNMGQAVIFDAPSGYYYIYGHKLNWIVREPYVARTKFKNLAAGKWQFWTGTEWSPDPALAKKISSAPVSPSFSVIKLENTYYLITQDNGYLTCGLGRDIYAYQSPVPTGKFTGKTTLYTIEDQINGHYLLTYNAQAHPEFLEGDQLLVSYNVNDIVDTLLPDICPSQCFNVFTDRMNADSYRPKFVRVPLSLLGIRKEIVKGLSASVYPNPASAALMLRFQSPGDQSGTLRITNTAGVIVKTEDLIMQKGENVFALDTTAFPHGVYFMILSSAHPEEIWEQTKFVK